MIQNGEARNPRQGGGGLGYWLIFAATLLAYLPALRAGFVWNDSDYVTAPQLRSLRGLWRIWFEIGSTQQYYPLLHTAFWAEHRLWGDAPLGYHLINVLLHATSACLFVVILRKVWDVGQTAGLAGRLAGRVAGMPPDRRSGLHPDGLIPVFDPALLAGLIFALHPVCVESVAWITEQKNTLSTVFYLLAALAYFRFRETRTLRAYCLGLILFAAAVLSKSVAATLPGALLVVVWWREGKLSWRRDFLPLIPWLIVGAAAGLVTGWVERKYIGAEGAAFALAPVDRVLVAGRVIWFYLGKLFWPANLIFIYPRWKIDAAAWWQYLYPLGMLALLAAGWRIRLKCRGPLAALLLFIGGLFPLLGFFNVYAFVFSYVTDHWQYLAMLGIIALVAGGMRFQLARVKTREGWFHPLKVPMAAGVVCLLGVLSWRECRSYRDAETFYRTMLARNPDNWMAHDNLGKILGEQGRFGEAIAECEEALRLNPAMAEAHLNLGSGLAAIGRHAEAVAHYREALRLRPNYAQAHSNLGVALVRLGEFEEAIDHLVRALNLQPNSPDIHVNLGNVLFLAGRFSEAIFHYEQALRFQPDHAGARQNLILAQNALKARGN